MKKNLINNFGVELKREYRTCQNFLNKLIIRQKNSETSYK